MPESRPLRPAVFVVPPWMRDLLVAANCLVVLAVGLLLVSVGASVAPASAASAPNGLLSASKLAVQTGQPVEVASLTDEYSRTFANPDGSTYSLEMSAAPQRVEQPDGSWSAIDNTLHWTADGRVAAAASVVGLELSGGGSGDEAITVSSKGSRLSLGWPGTLPRPTLDGATAIYANVMPGIDLLITAVDSGYRQVLRVQDAKAAANPALDRLTFALASDLAVLPDRGAGFQAQNALGEVIFRSPKPIMWDSAGGPRNLAVDSGVPASSAPSEAEPPFVAPSPGDLTKSMPVTVNDTAISVTPNQKVLGSPSTSFPVYIDPSVNLWRSDYIMVGSDNEADYNFGTTEGVGYCTDLCPRPPNVSSYVKRQYFEFTNSRLDGKHVLDATFRITETHSYSCTPSAVSIYRASGNISSSTRWPGPGGADKLLDRDVSAGRGDNCSPSQPDSTIEFNDSQTGDNLTQTIKNFAAGNYGGHVTIMIRANNEDDPNSWKRFDHDGTLSVTYMLIPGVPGAVGVRQDTNPDSRECHHDPAYATIVGDRRPVVAATVHALVPPTSDEDQGYFRGQFRLDRQLADGTWDTWWAGNQAPSSTWVAPGAEVTTSPASDLPEGLYRLKALTVSRGWNPITQQWQDLNSTFNENWCYFRIDTTGPKAPTVTSSLKPCTTNDCPLQLGPGQSANFTISTNDTNVASFGWRLDDGSEHSLGVQNRTSSSLSSTVSVKFPDKGEYTFVAWVVESQTNFRSASTRYKVRIAPGAGESGIWHVTEAPPAPGGHVATVADSADPTLHVLHALTLNGSANVDARGRREGFLDANSISVDDSSLTFPGSTSSYASTQTPVIDTSQSFTVSAWVYLLDASHNSTVVAQASDDNRSAGFAFRWNSGTRNWEFVWHYHNDCVCAATSVGAKSAAVQPVGVWTHLAGVYDAGTDTLQLYVNGRPQVAKTGVVTEATTGPLTVGMTHFQPNSPADALKGLVDEIHVWERAKTSAEVWEIAQDKDAYNQPALARVAAWDPSASPAGSSSVVDVSGYGHPSLSLTGGATVTVDENGAGVDLNGTSAMASTAGPLLDETGGFTVSSEVAISDVNQDHRILSQRSDDGSSWALSAVHDEAGGNHLAFSVWDASGVRTKARSFFGPTLNACVVITAVYDPALDADGDGSVGTISLYISSSPQGDMSMTKLPVQGSAEFTVGAGRGGSSWTDFLPGRFHRGNVWAGAMTPNEVNNLITNTKTC